MMVKLLFRRITACTLIDFLCIFFKDERRASDLFATFTEVIKIASLPRISPTNTVSGAVVGPDFRDVHSPSYQVVQRSLDLRRAREMGSRVRSKAT